MYILCSPAYTVYIQYFVSCGHIDQAEHSARSNRTSGYKCSSLYFGTLIFVAGITYLDKGSATVWCRIYLIQSDAQHAVGRCYYQLALIQSQGRIQHRSALLLPHSYRTKQPWHKLEKLFKDWAATVSAVSLWNYAKLLTTNITMSWLRRQGQRHFRNETL